MSTENAGSVAQELLANNVRVSKQMIGAYRAATGYFVGRIEGGMQKVLASAPAGRLNVQTRRNLGTVSQRLTGIYAKTFERISDGADKLVERIGDRSSDAIEKVGVTAIDNKYATRYVGLVNRVSLPPLKLARDLSGWVATRAEKLDAPRVTKHVKQAKRKVRKGAKRAA
jgi:hypothetical protein